MRTITTTVTERGQATIPAEVRRILNIRPRDKITFVIEDGEVKVRAAEFTVETAFASVKPVRPVDGPVDIDQLIDDAKAEKATKTIRKMRRN
jgi:antitoxin PrlF